MDLGRLTLLDSTRLTQAKRTLAKTVAQSTGDESSCCAGASPDKPRTPLREAASASPDPRRPLFHSPAAAAAAAAPASPRVALRLLSSAGTNRPALSLAGRFTPSRLGHSKRGGKRPLSRYERSTELVRQLGSGSCGAVYRGSCEDEAVAVKVVELAPENAESVRREVQALRECASHHIVAYRDAFLRKREAAASLWIVMEYCDGGSALDVMRARGAPLSEPQVAAVIASVLRALDHLHVERNLVHRDIKSANVLLTRSGVVKLADLGDAARLSVLATEGGAQAGTTFWMAPEVLGAGVETDGVDAAAALDWIKADIWSLGITAIELAEMAPPHSELASVYEASMRIAHGPSPSLAPSTAASVDFGAFVDASLAREPVRRPTASALLRGRFAARADSGSCTEYGAPHSPTAEPVGSLALRALFNDTVT